MKIGMRERERLICLTSPDPPKNCHVREKARLGRLRGFTHWSNEENRMRKEKENISGRYVWH